MTGRYCPILGIFHQSEGLAVLIIKMDASSTVGNVVADDDLPVTQGNIVEGFKSVNACLNVPDRSQIARYLLLDRGADQREILQRNVIGLRKHRNLVEHNGPPLIQSSRDFPDDTHLKPTVR